MVEGKEMGNAHLLPHIRSLRQPGSRCQQGISEIRRMVFANIHWKDFELIVQCLGPIPQQRLRVATCDNRDSSLHQNIVSPMVRRFT